jgi:hypothetical protein
MIPKIVVYPRKWSVSVGFEYPVKAVIGLLKVAETLAVIEMGDTGFEPVTPSV